MKIMKDGNIDLTDPKTIEAIRKDKVVEATPDTEDVAAEKAIKAAKNAKVTLTLNHAENAQLTRMASVQGKDVKTFLSDKIHELLLDSNVGMPLINGPSAGRVRVSGPSKSFGRDV